MSAIVPVVKYALPVATKVGKGVVMIKGLSAAQLAKRGIRIVNSKNFVRQMTPTERKSLERESKKKGMKIKFDIHIRNNNDYKRSNNSYKYKKK